MEALLDQGFCGDDILRYAYQGAAYLFDRVREFRSKPDAFGQYTAIFLKAYESKCATANLGTVSKFLIDESKCATANLGTVSKLIDFAAARSNKVLQFRPPT